MSTPIHIGKREAVLKEIGSAAREDLERLLGCRVYPELAVKTAPGWSRDPRGLAAFGL